MKRLCIVEKNIYEYKIMNEYANEVNIITTLYFVNLSNMCA